MTSSESADWTEARRALWERLRDYRFGDDRAQAFLDRIAHACQSSREFAEGALEEYRRFCFLAVAAGHEVTPSETIDKVWHAHMTDTRDYWMRFCPQALKQDLHHAPSLGGQAEYARHQQQYRDTLDSYRRFFDEPPIEFWPSPRAPLQARKPVRPGESRVRLLSPWASAPVSVGSAFWVWSLVIGAVYLLCGFAQGTFNPLNWRGGAFLALYIPGIVWAFVAGSVIKRSMRGPNKPDGGRCDDPVELGFLAGGSERAADVAIVELLERDALTLDYTGNPSAAAQQRETVWLRINAAAVGHLPLPLRTAADIAQREQNLSATLKALTRAYTPIAAQLRRKGWWLSAQREWQMRLMGSTPLLAWTALGAIKVAIGMLRDKPVGFLVVLTLLSAILTLGRLVREQSRTRAGDWVLHDASQQLAEEAPPQRTALMGTIGLIGTGWGEYHTLRTPVSNSSSSDSGSSSSGGGDGGGGGGCGGGGCGGCGGG
ncbi:MAG: TIGR04222 domain-containing membrane protein [Lysobacter sp.]